MCMPMCIPAHCWEMTIWREGWSHERDLDCSSSARQTASTSRTATSSEDEACVCPASVESDEPALIDARTPKTRTTRGYHINS